MSSLAETIAFIFGIIGFGYLAGWTGLLRTSTGDALSAFAVAVALPLLLFRTMVEMDFGAAAPWPLWLTYFAAVAAVWICGHLVVTRAFGRDTRAGVVGGLAASFSNLVLLGAPFMLGVYGRQGFEVLSVIVAVHLPIMIGTSILLFEWTGRGQDGTGSALALARSILGSLLSNPLIVGILCGLAWRASGLSMPSLGERFVDALAEVAGPVALFAMGLGLRKFTISGNIGAALTVSTLKLFLMPAVALVMAKLVGLPPFSAKVAVAAAALPSGLNPYLVAMRFGTGQALASNATTITTACGVLTTAFWLAVAQAAFG